MYSDELGPYNETADGSDKIDCSSVYLSNKSFREIICNTPNLICAIFKESTQILTPCRHFESAILKRLERETDEIYFSEISIVEIPPILLYERKTRASSILESIIFKGYTRLYLVNFCIFLVLCRAATVLNIHFSILKVLRTKLFLVHVFMRAHVAVFSLILVLTRKIDPISPSKT